MKMGEIPIGAPDVCFKPGKNDCVVFFLGGSDFCLVIS